MQNLRDKLIKAGLVSADHVARGESGKRAGGQNGQGGQNAQNAQTGGAGQDGGGQGSGGQGAKPAGDGAPKRDDGKKRRKRGKGGAASLGFGRHVDVPDARTLEILRAVEQHRLRGDTRGDSEFHFELRDGRIRKMFVTREVAHGLTSGRFAIVECGDPERHIVVERDAVSKIRSADERAVRFFNEEAVAAVSASASAQA